METVSNHWLAWVVFLVVAGAVIFGFVKFAWPAIKRKAAEEKAKEAAKAAPAPAGSAIVIDHTIADPLTVSVAGGAGGGGAGTARNELVVPGPWMPAGIYPSSLALYQAVQAANFSQQVRLNGQQIWPGFGPGADYFQSADGSVLLGRRTEPTTAPPIPEPPAPPQPPAPAPGMPLTADEIRAGVQPFPPYGAKTDGEKFASDAARAAWVAAVLGQGTAPVVTPDTPMVPAIDAAILNDRDWEYYNSNPRTWGLVYGDRNYISNKIQEAFARTKGSFANPETYNGALRLS